MVWAVNQHTHQSLSTSPSPQSLGHIKKRAHRVLLCHLISTNNQLRKTQEKPGRRGLKGRNPEVFCISSPEVRIRFFPSFSILPEYPSNDPLNPSPSLVLPPSKYLWNVSMLPFYHLIWNDHHLGVRLLPLCLHTEPASNTETIRPPPCLNLFAWIKKTYLLGHTWLSPAILSNLTSTSRPGPCNYAFVTQAFSLMPILSHMCFCLRVFAPVVPVLG